MPSTHDVWIEANTNGIRSAKLISELFKDRNIVDIQNHTEVLSFFNFSKVNTVRCKQNFIRCKTSLKTQSHFINAYTVKARTETLNIFQHVDVGKRFARVIKACLTTGECLC